MTAIPFAVALAPWLADHWFRLALVVIGLILLLVAFFKRQSLVPAWSFGLAGLALALVGLGGLLIPAPFVGYGWERGPGAAPWSVATSSWWMLSLVGLLAVIAVAAMLLMVGYWHRWLAVAALVPLLLGLGGFVVGHAEEHLGDLWQTFVEMRIRAPFWLLLLGAIPVIVLLGFRRLNRNEARPWIAMGLRILGVGVLALALAEPYFNQPSKAMTVLFVLDRSLSVPEELGKDDVSGEKIDLRSKRILKFINESVQMRGSGHERDRAGLIVFGRRPRLDLSPSDAPRFNLTTLPDIEDGSYTDIGAALKLGLASFPEGTARRMVLISDGNENLGNAEEQARLAKTLGVQIDVLPLGGGERNDKEILVERVDAPAVIEQGSRVPIRVLVRSHNPNVVVGRLTLRQITDKEGTMTIKLGPKGELGVEVEPIAVVAGKGVRIVKVTPRSPADRAGLEVGEEIADANGTPVDDETGLANVLLRAKGEVRLTMRRNPVRIVAVREPAKVTKGLNIFTFDRPLTDEQRSYTYEAEYQPLRVEDEKGQKLHDGVPGDRVQNNRASTHVVARGQGRVLLLENKAGDHKELTEKLVEAGKGRFKVVSESVDILANYKERDKLSVFLSNFDCVILANVPAERIPEEQQEVIRSNTHDQGCGLVMIGGPDSFGAGGWQNTPVEKALPVDADIRQLKVQGKGGLVLIMHACEMAQGNFWEKKVAKLAVERLGPNDEVGIIYWNFADIWAVPMMEAGPNRQKILGMIDKMSPNDMPDFSPGLRMAHDALMDKKKDFGTKHIIIISDGDPQVSDQARLKKIKSDKITIATVGIATHGGITDQNMEAIATAIPGTGKKRFYKVDDPKKLPAIYIKETRLVSQSFVHKVKFMPVLHRTGPAAKLPDLLELGGYVRTTPKNSPLVEIPILTPQFKMADQQQDFPILAHWHYGLGKAVAFTSDAGQPDFWSRRWLTGDGKGEGIYAGFWEQVIGWALRPVESGRLVMNTEHRDGKIKILVEARTQDGKPDTNLKLRGGLTLPGTKPGAEGKKEELRFVQKNSGQYEAEVKAEEAGSYFVNAQATRMGKTKDGKPLEEGTDSVRAGVTLPYSPEFRDLESNTGLLTNLADLTEGKVYADDSDLLAELAKEGTVFRAPETRSKTSMPFHYWLMFLAAGFLLIDVAVRRIAFDTEQAAEQANYLWSRVRGIPVPPPAQTTSILRLRARPTDVLASSDKATRRFEGSPVFGSPTFADASAPVKPTQPRPATGKQSELDAPQQEQKEGSMEDLLAAKKKVWDDRKKEK